MQGPQSDLWTIRTTLLLRHLHLSVEGEEGEGEGGEGGKEGGEGG